MDDLVSGMIKIMAKENFAGPVNLGNPGEFTVLELAKKVLSLTGSKSGIIYKALPEDGPKKESRI